MSDKNIPLLDIPIDYIMGDDVTGTLLNEYGRFPCKIKAAIFAFCAHGEARATINITEHRVKTGDYIMLPPNSFILIHEVSADAQFVFLGFSSNFVERTNYGKILMGYINMVFEHPIISLPKAVSEVIRDAFLLLTRADKLTDELLSPEIMVSVMNLFMHATLPLYEQLSIQPKIPTTREGIIGKEFLTLVLQHYAKEHRLQFYAQKMGITLPHLCATVKKSLHITPTQVITRAIITDAKAQLKSSDLQIKEIALALGFSNISFFNKFFKAQTGITPKQYREGE